MITHCFAVSAICISMAVSLMAQNDNGSPLVLSMTFSHDDLDISQVEGFDCLKLKDAGFIYTDQGPNLPAKYLRLALPFGFDASRLVARPSGEVRIEMERPVIPCIKPRTGHSAPSKDPKYIMGSVYNEDTSFPGVIAEILLTGTLSGYPMVEIAVYPIQYNPVKQEIVLYETIDLQLELTPSGNSDRTSWAVGSEENDSFRRMVQSMVDNPNEVPIPDLKNRASLSTPPVEYLIITHADYVTEFQRLADWKTKKGVWTEIVTIAYIDQHYSGLDLQEKIRNCISAYKEEYCADFVYVLLGGDNDIIPCRYAHVSAVLSTTVSPDIYQNIPSDLYYAALEGTWNADGDNQYGEFPDDHQEPHDPLDWSSDVFVGRAPVDTLDQVILFVDKVLLYEGADPALPMDYQKELFFVSANMDDKTHCNVLKDQIDVEFVNFSGSNYFNIAKAHNLNKSISITELNYGKNVVNHAGHGWVNGVQTALNNPSVYLNSNDVSALTNWPRLTGVMYSTSCFSGAFDVPLNDPSLSGYSDCFGEYFVLAPNGGGAAYIGNSRAGLYWEVDPINPPNYTWETLSHWYDRAFFREIYFVHQNQTDFDKYVLGKAFAYARQSTPTWERPSANIFARYCMYEQNLFGDPEMPIFKNRLEALGPDFLVLDHKIRLKMNPFGTQLKVTITSGSTGENVEDVNVCLWKPGDVFTENRTNQYGEVLLDLNPTSTGTMYITATKIDDNNMQPVFREQFVPGQSTIEVVNQDPLVADTTHVNVYDLSEIVNFALDAQPVNAGRPYFLLGTMSGTSPGTPLLGGVTLPLNYDTFMQFITQYPNPPMFINFVGYLDANGKATAIFDHQGLMVSHLFEELHFAYFLTDLQDFASNAVPVYLTNISQHGGPEPE